MLDTDYELIEQAEILFQNNNFHDAKKVLEYLLSEESDVEEPYIRCYIRLLYVEAMIELGHYEEQACFNILEEAKKYCSYVDDDCLRDELYIILAIDFSKIYLDSGEYINAQNYVLEALEKSLEFGDSNYCDRAAQNFLLLCQTEDLYAKEREELNRYSTLIKNCLFSGLIELNKEQMVIVFLKMAEICFANQEIDQGNLIFQRAFELNKEVDVKCGYIHSYLVKYSYIMSRHIKKNLLTEIIKYVTKAVLLYIDEIETVDDEELVYRLCVDISGVLRIFIAYVNLGLVECSKEEYFEYVMNIKNIYSLVLSIRNRPHDNSMLKEWVGYEDLIKKIPDDTILIDYTQFPVLLSEERLLGHLALSCFSVKKHNNQFFLTLHNPVYLLQERAMQLLLNATTRTDRERVADFINENFMINKNLYDLLIKEVLQDVHEEYLNLYICPDVEVGNIPFSILVDENNKYLLERYRITYIDSFRCFQGELGRLDLKNGSALILGDPRYSVDSKCNLYTELNVLQSLPLSKIESQIVAELLDVSPMTKELATKRVLENCDSQIIHIATHGKVHDIDEEEENSVFPLSRCCMYFAGANDYKIFGKRMPEYDDGVLTAAELLKSNIRGVELCVLSICFSGNGQVDYSQGLLGFRTVFLSKGVRTLISSIWEVDDFASAVFFSKFYKDIFTMCPSEALRSAQMHLKNISIGELREEGWFEKSKIKKLGLVARQMEELSKLPRETRIFQRAKYWAGFVLTMQ